MNLRDRLLALRRGALDQLARSDRLNNEMLHLVADTSAVLAALDAEAEEAAPPVPGDRALVSDDNLQIEVVVHSADRQAAAATLSPAAAIRLGNQLVAAGARRL